MGEALDVVREAHNSSYVLVCVCVCVWGGGGEFTNLINYPGCSTCNHDLIQ
jgi:hypothetical protein